MYVLINDNPIATEGPFRHGATKIYIDIYILDHHDGSFRLFNMDNQCYCYIIYYLYAKIAYNLRTPPQNIAWLSENINIISSSI